MKAGLRKTVLSSRRVRNLVSGWSYGTKWEYVERIPGRRQSTREADRVWGSWLHTAVTPQRVMSVMAQVLFQTGSQMSGMAAWLEDGYRMQDVHRLPQAGCHT